MVKRWLIVWVFFYSSFSFSQIDEQFQNKLDSLKKIDNFTEYVYLSLDEFVKNVSIENLSVLENVENNLWREPVNKQEALSSIYFNVNYGYYLKQLGFIHKSVLKYENAKQIYESHQVINYDIIEFCLKPLANNYTRLGEVERAEDILKISIEKAQKENKVDQIIVGYSNLAIVYRTVGAYNKAINYLKLALDLESNPEGKSKIYSDLAINFLYLKNVSKTVENIKKSNKLNHQNNNSILMRNEISLANCFLLNKEFDNALKELEKALKNAGLVFGERDREIAKIQNQIGNVFLEKGLIIRALEYYQKALFTLMPMFNHNSVIENPILKYFYPENSIKESLDGKAAAFYLQGDFENALVNYELAFKVEDELRASYLSQESKINQQQENRQRSEKCIELCYELYQKTNNLKWVERAFQFAEKSKSIILLEAKKAGLLKSQIKNDSLFLIEKDLIFKKAQLNNNIVVEELKGDKASVNLLSKLTNERDRIFNKLQLLKLNIEAKFPSLKVESDSVISIKEIKEKLLQKNQSLVEFFDGKHVAYVFAISKENDIKIVKIAKDSIFNKQLTLFLDFFTKSRGVSIQNNVNEYTKLGYELFKSIFKIELNKNVIIVPDGIFSFIPFDALLTQKETSYNFNELSYLIKKYNVSYAYSASIELQDNKYSKSLKEGLLGFFPVFRGNYRGLAELNYTELEAQSVTTSTNGKVLLNSEATKNKFTKSIDKYSIVHLSTHASGGDFYTPPSIEFYDKTLYLPEIYGYDLNLDLLVLSACETGMGTLRKGEGAMSLARGFTFAGVENLIVSLWSVNDKSTKELMAGFYRNFKKSGNKSLALHKSKLDYLENNLIDVSKKSPYYWAGFIYIGDSTFDDSRGNYLIWILIVGLTLLVVYLSLKNSRFGLNKR